MENNLILCCPVCGRVLPSSSFCDFDGLCRWWDCPSCRSSGLVSRSASGAFSIHESPLVGDYYGYLGDERDCVDCLVPLFRPSDVTDIMMSSSGRRLWRVFASSGVQVGWCRRVGCRVDAWHMLRDGRVVQCWVDGDGSLDDVQYVRDWVASGACGALPAGCFVGS